MGQIKIFGIREQLHPIREKVSEIIHECVMDAFQYPKEKKAHRFIYIDADSFYFFEGRTERHTIIEISVFEGRSIEAKKKLHKLLFQNFETVLGITNMDLEITIFETPMYNWGIRGKSGDELALNYQVEV
ncbi:tautomerase family protein [Lacihabitans sp. LS3-19]|uniref:tautomerase family protein n=1 Tax=Lacihabitans sp. LS3-19 TaxID=2487335 RepID=UPI0020CEDDE3|nr:tautomerase family protein [Lacihabitans sp. LS3-19]MCP9767301.1 tautomerase family protein [Lacihabitans sp. LS3-19]